jgi:hypothetical protein
MAKDRRKVQHIHSSVPDKQPTPASLEVGEIAVNNSKNQEFLSIKNSEDKVVRFSSDEQVITIVERKEVMPYEGLVRGAEGPGGNKDSYNSYGITEGDLRDNKSNLIIKLNQVAAGNTTKHDKVNGAKDIYNNLVNPTTDGGLNDGAGFAIDMSRYAMRGANPSFSSVTTTCHAEFNGRTEIIGGTGETGDCRSYLKIDVLTADTKAGSAKTAISTATTIIGTNDTTISGDTILNVSGTTTENYLQDVNINNNQDYSIKTSGNTVIHSNGAIGITSFEDIMAISSEGDVIITANDNLCATAGDSATIYGKEVTNVGTSCNGTGASTNTNISGSTIGIGGDTLIETISQNSTVNVGGNYITNVSGNTQMFSTGKTCINSSDNLNIGSDANTNIGVNCEGNVYSNNVNINATSSINESANTVNIDGSSTINIEAPTTNVISNTTLNLKGNTINVSANTYSSYTTSKTCILANTDLNIGGNSNTKIGADCNGSVYSDNTFIDASSSVTINAPVTNITGDTNISGDTIIEGDTIIDGKLIISGTGLSTKLSWTYDNVCNATGDSTNFKTDKSFKIPSSVAHIKRETLSWSYGSVSDKTAGAYDPGSNTSSNCTQNSNTSKITIPKSIDHLDEWNGTCFMIPHNLCVSGTVTSTGGMYTSSDEVLKDDIHYIRGEEISRARKVELKSFYYKSDPSKRKVYGVIAQDLERLGLEELVHHDENGIRSVDYTGLLLLKIAALEKEISILKNKFDEQK